jgi:sortase A
MRRAVRWLGTSMILVGSGLLAWCLLVWLWEDPFTGLYTSYEQRQLAQSYDRLESAYRPRVPAPAPPAQNTRAALAAERRHIAVEATRFRADAGQGAAIGRLSIPSLGLDMVVVNGTDAGSLKRGPGRDLRTFMPGQGELVYIAGHRTTYSAPFSDIDELKRGDRFTLRVPYATFVYAVTGHVVVAAGDIGRLRSSGREVLALQACHPRFFASHRYIVYAAPVQLIPRGGSVYTLPRRAVAYGAPSAGQASLR